MKKIIQKLKLTPLLFASAQLPPGQPITLSEIDNIIATLVKFIMGLTGTLMVIFIVWSGIRIMTSQGNPAAFAKATGQLKAAAIGAAVIMGAGVIVNTIFALVTRDFFCQLSVAGVCLY